MITYNLSKTCKVCGCDYESSITKIEAAFDNYTSKLLESLKCPKCKRTEYSRASHQKPDLDEEIMSIWAGDSSLVLSQQDEDLILGNGENIDLINLLRRKIRLRAKNIFLSRHYV